METTHINNLISLVAEATVDAMRQTLPSEQKLREHLHNNDLYGELPEVVIEHIMSCVTTVASHVKAGEIK